MAAEARAPQITEYVNHVALNGEAKKVGTVLMSSGHSYICNFQKPCRDGPWLPPS